MKNAFLVFKLNLKKMNDLKILEEVKNKDYGQNTIIIKTSFVLYKTIRDKDLTTKRKVLDYILTNNLNNKYSTEDFLIILDKLIKELEITQNYEECFILNKLQKLIVELYKNN